MSKDLASGDLFHERYEIVRLIGRGGMGAVYEVIDQKTRRPRALKLMRADVLNDDEMRARFKREAVVAAEIESEHVAETIDAGVDASTGAPFIVLELLTGKGLSDLVAEQDALPAETVVVFVRQAAIALHKAHQVGVVHRDLKPENLFVTQRDDGSPRIKLLDFGIAKIVSATTGPQTQGVLGTPMYMAPEQMHGERKITAQTDVYALGHIAYTLLVGECYWAEEERSATSVYQLLVKLMKGPPEAASKRAKRRRDVELSAAFDAFFNKATADDPDDRHDGTLALLDALVEALGVAGQPAAHSDMLSLQASASELEAPLVGGPTPPPTSRTLQSIPRTSPAPFIAGAALAAAAIGVLIWTSVGSRNAAEEEPAVKQPAAMSGTADATRAAPDRQQEALPTGVPAMPSASVVAPTATKQSRPRPGSKSTRKPKPQKPRPKRPPPPDPDLDLPSTR